MTNAVFVRYTSLELYAFRKGRVTADLIFGIRLRRTGNMGKNYC
jgi:hypothetical protein